ncbi:MAG: methyltransferase domain-containing protein [Alphaproteobacteria bacterium]|nr:methyltransferase domain-containing protein [Alphaproteobacteria bacterium]
MNAVDDDAHRDFLNRYYRWSRPIYDLTRKYYLLGRDRTLRALAAEPWRGLVEIGPGTGRNLVALRRLRPDAVLGGVEACDAMLALARTRLPDARLVHGFAESAPYADLLGVPVERVLFSYSLSMIQDPDGALRQARAQVAPGGSVVVVDFGDLRGLPRPAADALTRWLRTFHVAPLQASWLTERGASLTWGPGRYYVVATFPSTASRAA